MIRHIEAPKVIFTVSKTPTVGSYLRGIAALAMEVSTRPWLLPHFVEVIGLVPTTVRELERTERRRIAA
jgi:hypothetical protein